MNDGDVSQEVCEDLLVRSLHRCVICHEAEVQIHHAKGRASKDANNVKYLIPLCPNCHSKAEGKGGHGRQYTLEELTGYKERWFKMVERFHEDSLRLAVQRNKEDPLRVHPNVVPSSYELYLALDAACGVLDIPMETSDQARERVYRARTEVVAALRHLERGGRILAETRIQLANLIQDAAKMKAYTRIREMNNVLLDVVDVLRR